MQCPLVLIYDRPIASATGELCEEHPMWSVTLRLRNDDDMAIVFGLARKKDAEICRHVLLGLLPSWDFETHIDAKNAMASIGVTNRNELEERVFSQLPW